MFEALARNLRLNRKRLKTLGPAKKTSSQLYAESMLGEKRANHVHHRLRGGYGAFVLFHHAKHEFIVTNNSSNNYVAALITFYRGGYQIHDKMDYEVRYDEDKVAWWIIARVLYYGIHPPFQCIVPQRESIKECVIPRP